MFATARHTHSPRTARRVLALVAVGALVGTACGGSDSGDGTAGDATEFDTPDVDLGELEDSDLDTSGLDAGQEDLLDDVAAGLEDEFDDDEDAAEAAWAGIRLLSTWGDVRLETLDADQFSGVVENSSTPIADGLSNPGNIDNHVVTDDSVWVSATTSLSRVSLADGTVTATIPIDDVLPGGEFGGITGDADGVYVLATIVGGADVIADIDPTTGTVRGTIDLTNDVTSLATISSNGTHVAAAYKDAPGIPVKLIERSTGAITDVGDYLQLHEAHIVRDELWVIVASSTTTVPDSYEKYALDGTPLGTGELPSTGQVEVFGDRIVVVVDDNAADPSNPVAPIEVEPQGAPIESFLPAGTVLLSAYAEIDGFAVSSGSCCLKDDGDFPLNTAVVDMATGELVHTADSSSATAILPAG